MTKYTVIKGFDIRLVRDKWNANADKFNQWGELDWAEKCRLVIASNNDDKNREERK